MKYQFNLVLLLISIWALNTSVGDMLFSKQTSALLKSTPATSKYNYIDTIRKHKSAVDTSERPLKDFLSVPISSFEISSGYNACGKGISTTLLYTRIDDTTFECTATKIWDDDSIYNKPFHRKIDSRPLTALLKSMNANPWHVSPIKDYNITEADKKAYLAAVRKEFRYTFDDFICREERINKESYRSVLNRLDTMQRATLIRIAGYVPGGSTAEYYFTITITNENKESMTIKNMWEDSDGREQRTYSIFSVIDYKKNGFRCINAGIAKIFNPCLSDDFYGKDRLSNVNFLMQIGHYYYNGDYKHGNWYNLKFPEEEN